MRRRFLILTLILSLLLTPGCWDKTEINNSVVTVGGGFDLASNDRLMATIQMATPITGPGENPFVTDSAVGVSASDALSRISLTSPRHKFLEHISGIVIGEDLARHGLIDINDYLLRTPVIRERESVFIARNASANSLLKVPVPTEQLPIFGLLYMIRNQDPRIGFYTETNKSEMIDKMITPGIEPVVPGVEILRSRHGTLKLRLSGMAAFKKGKLAGWLNENESRGYRWLRPKGVQGGSITVSCPVGGEPVTLEIMRGSAKMAPEIRGRRIIMHIIIKQDGNFYEERCNHNLLTPYNIKRLENEENKKIEAEVMAAVKKAQKIDSDIFGFGLAISHEYPREWKRLQNTWEQQFPNVEVDVNAVSKIRRIGLLARIFMYE